MTIDEAIRRLDAYLEKHRSSLPFEDRDALGLGIEALKAIKGKRAGLPIPSWRLLPGETKD